MANHFKRGSFDSTRHSFIRSALRRSSMRWKPRNEALKAARVDRGRYKCAMCLGTFGNKQIILDHIVPVVPTSGFTNWDDYCMRLFCPKEGFQVLCRLCSEIKTSIEDKLRINVKEKDKTEENVKKILDKVKKKR